MKKELKKLFSETNLKKNKISFKCFDSNCFMPAINSHSQSLSNALKKIAEKGILIKLGSSLIPNENTDIDSHFRKIGINQASTFRGFCNKHDHEYFKTVDNFDLGNINKAILARLAFRTFAYEERTKEKILFSMDYIIKGAGTLCDVSRIEGFANGIRNHLKVTKPYYSNRFVKIFKSQDYKCINGLVFILNKKIPVSCSTVIDPSMLNSSSLMQHPLERPLNLLFFNLIPQLNSGLAVFVYFQEHAKMLKRFIRHYRTLENIIFNHCEELLFAPSYYNSLDVSSKVKIINGLRSWIAWDKEEFPNLFNVKLESPICI